MVGLMSRSVFHAACGIFVAVMGGGAPFTAWAAHYTVHHEQELNRLWSSGKLQPGDEVIWASGEYTDAVVRLSGVDGTADAPLTLRSETPGGTVLRGKSRLEIGSDHVVISGFKFICPSTGKIPSSIIRLRGSHKDPANHCRLTRLQMEQDEPGPSLLTKCKWVVLYGEGHRVDRCTFIGKRTRDNTLTVYLPSDTKEDGVRHRIEHNHFAHRPNGRQANGDPNGWESIRIGDSKTSHLPAYCLVRGNLFEHCDGEIEIISNKSRFNDYRENLFLHCLGQLTLRHGGDCTVLRNIFIGDGQEATEESGVRIIGPRHVVAGNLFVRLSGKGTRGTIVLSEGVQDGAANEYLPVTEATIRHNLILDCEQPFVLGALSGKKVSRGKRLDVPPTSTVISGNLILGATPLVTILSSETPQVTFIDNDTSLAGEMPLALRHGRPFPATRLIAPDLNVNLAGQIQAPLASLVEKFRRQTGASAEQP